MYVETGRGSTAMKLTIATGTSSTCKGKKIIFYIENYFLSEITFTIL